MADAWEEVNSKDLIQFTYRMRVPGGWLYRYAEGEQVGAGKGVTCMAFVPDPDAGRQAPPLEAPEHPLSAMLATHVGRQPQGTTA
jgi:hypothetical protein